MFIIYELGVIVKAIVSIIGYVLFLPLNLLDNLIFSKVFGEPLVSNPIVVLILFFILFLALGIFLKSCFKIIKIGFLLFLFYLVSDFFAGVILIFITLLLVYLFKKARKKQIG